MPEAHVGRGLELITVRAVQPNLGLTMNALASNSLTIRDSTSPIWFVGGFSSRQAVGFVRWTSPLLHDAVVGMQYQQDSQVSASAIARMDTERSLQRLYPQDTLVAFGAGTNVALGVELSSFLAAYENLPGVDGYFIDEAELDKRADDVYSFPVTCTPALTTDYSGRVGITSSVDQLKANTDYAIIGWRVQARCHAVRYVGQDWGNLGIGGPGGFSESLTQEFFVRLTRTSGMPLIPVFNASNKSNTFVDISQDQSLTAVTLSTIAVRLMPKAMGKRQ